MSAAVAPPPHVPPPALPRFEYNLVRLARFCVGALPAEQVATALSARAPLPDCLSRGCVELVQETLAKGVILRLVRAGGWRPQRHLRDAGPVTGRAWERGPLAERQLDFSRAPLDFLMWLTAERLAETRRPWDADPDAATAADELFFFLAYDALRDGDPPAAEVLRAKRAVAGNGLVRLAHPSDFAADAPPPAPRYDAWMTGPRAVALECYQPVLMRAWVRLESAKGLTADWSKLRREGAAQEAVLTAYLDACGRAGRTDLGRFALTAAKAVLGRPNLTPDDWLGALADPAPTRLADRLDARRAAFGLVRAVATLQAWDRRARAVGYWDDGFAASQVWKEGWEAAGGEALAAAARDLLARVEPLRTG